MMMLKKAALAIALMSLAPAMQASQCSDWGTCNATLTLNATPDASFPNHVLDAETEHFAIFLDPAAPGTAAITPAKYQIMQDQLECAYRYFVCERKLEFPHTEKVPVYVGPIARAPAAANYIEIGEWALADTLGLESKVYNQPVHEFFHRIAFSFGAYNTYQALTEGLTTLAEQMISEETFGYSLADTLGGRTASITQPHDDFTHSKNIFFRYAFEQIAGRAVGQTVDEDWAADELLAPMLEWMRIRHNENIDTILPSLLESEAIPGVSLVSKYDELIDNYQTMRYAFDKIQLKSSCVENKASYPQVKYSYRNTAELESVATFSPFTSGTVLAVGDTLHASNIGVDYGGVTQIFGFREYLAAEYHTFQVEPGVYRLRFTRGKTQDNIRFQLIYQKTNGCVIPHQVLERGAFTETVTLPRGAPIEEMVLVAYSTSALAADSGRLFEVTVEAIR